MAKKRLGHLIILSGPSGVGKDSVISRIRFLNKQIYASVSFTTRPIRVGEKDGASYHFISEEEFKNKINNNDFLEYTSYCGYYYGTLKKTVVDAVNSGRDIILKIDVDGAAKVRTLGINCISIFISPPSFDDLKERIRIRGTDHIEMIQDRLKRVEYEMSQAKNYDYVVVNDLVDKCAHEILEILGY